MSAAVETGVSEDDPVPSNPMPGGTLADQVIAARTARGMTAGALQLASGLSARTIRDIEHGHPTRRYSPTTLAALDRALGWPPNTAWNTWRAHEQILSAPMYDEIAEQMAAITAKVAEMAERPPWMAEVIDVFRLLSPEDRRRLLDLAWRLAPG